MILSTSHILISIYSSFLAIYMTNKDTNDKPEQNLNPKEQNKSIIDAFYKALATGDTQKVTSFLAADLEYWFHGPPKCQHMMRVLTGYAGCKEFEFDPQSIEVVGDYVIAEGWEGKNAYWVHVWTLKDGVVTQFREYFNTWLTVTYIDPHSCKFVLDECTFWESQPDELARRSLPGILLAI